MELNQAVSHIRTTKNLALPYGSLDRETLHLRAYTDASFATNDDHSSQLGFVVLLCDAEDRCHILDFASRKCKRVVRGSVGITDHTALKTLKMPKGAL